MTAVNIIGNFLSVKRNKFGEINSKMEPDPGINSEKMPKIFSTEISIDSSILLQCIFGLTFACRMRNLKNPLDWAPRDMRVLKRE